MHNDRSVVRAWCGVIMALLASGSGARAAANALTNGHFRDEVIVILRAIRPGSEIRPGSDPAQVRIGSRTIDLTNLHMRLEGRSPSERRRAIESFLSALSPVEAGQSCCKAESYATIKPRLRVQLVPDDIIRDHPELARRSFSRSLHVVYVLDEPQRYRYVTNAMLAGWKVDSTVVEAVAVQNLEEASGDIPAELAMDKDEPSYLLSHAGDDYDAARLLVPSFLKGLLEALKADAIVLAAPTRDLVMAWPSGSRRHGAFAALVSKLRKAGPYGRSDELFRFDGRALRPLTPIEGMDHGR